MFWVVGGGGRGICPYGGWGEHVFFHMGVDRSQWQVTPPLLGEAPPPPKYGYPCILRLVLLTLKQTVLLVDV